MEHKYFLGWVVPMFSYGFYRGMTAEYKAPNDLLTYKLINSTANACFYSSPFGIMKVGALMNRIEIHMLKKDKQKYPFSYEECYSVNNKIF